jgi:hypothetical protein
MNRCRTCKHFSPSKRLSDCDTGRCDSPKIWRGYRVTIQDILPDGALVEDDETEGLIVAPEFGCVHHEVATFRRRWNDEVSCQ